MTEYITLEDRIEREKQEILEYEDYLFNEEVHLIEHYPDYFKENDQIIAICDAADPEFNLFRQRAIRALNNQIVGTSDEYGIRSYEELVGIIPDPSLSLKERKAQVLARMNETLPYTEIRLQRMLAAIVGWGNFKYSRDGAHVHVELMTGDSESTKAVYQLLQRVLPLNLYFDVTTEIVDESKPLTLLTAGMTTQIFETPIYIDNSWQIAETGIGIGLTSLDVIDIAVNSEENRRLNTSITKAFNGSIITEEIEVK